MLTPEDVTPHPCTDKAARYFRVIPTPFLIAKVMGIDEVAARWLRGVALRMPSGQGVTWLNDVAFTLAQDYPFHPVMVVAMQSAQHGLIWKRKAKPHAT